jgi:hypothetical protein
VGKWVVDFRSPSSPNDSGLASTSRAVDLLFGAQADAALASFAYVMAKLALASRRVRANGLALVAAHGLIKGTIRLLQLA